MNFPNVKHLICLFLLFLLISSNCLVFSEVLFVPPKLIEKIRLIKETYGSHLYLTNDVLCEILDLKDNIDFNGYHITALKTFLNSNLDPQFLINVSLVVLDLENFKFGYVPIRNNKGKISVESKTPPEVAEIAYCAWEYLNHKSLYTSRKYQIDQNRINLALRNATRAKMLGLTKGLIFMGADPRATDECGVSALGIAQESNQYEAMRMMGHVNFEEVTKEAVSNRNTEWTQPSKAAKGEEKAPNRAIERKLGDPLR